MEAEVCTAEEFNDFFEMLLIACGKKDEKGLLCVAYYEAIAKLSPTVQEVWAAVQGWLDVNGSKFPAGQELREMIRDNRKANQPYLPPSQNAGVMYPGELTSELSPESIEYRRQCRILFLTGVYLNGGDSKLYRDLLEGRNGIYSGILQKLTETVSHEDVMAEIASRKKK